MLSLNWFAIEQSHAQDSLPSFSVEERNGMVIIGWKNPFQDLTQLVIQRSYDSSKGFKSIMAMPDPTSVSNGYVDKSINAINQYYRLFYVQPGGRYFFTASAKPIKSNLANPLQSIQLHEEIDKNNVGPTEKKDLISYINNKKNKLGQITSPTNLESVLPENLFTPSTLIFSNKDGDLVLALPEANQKKYLLKVFRDNGSIIFTMKEIRHPQLVVDRSNFYHSGWFTYELYEEDKFKEKNKFFIPPID